MSINIYVGNLSFDSSEGELKGFLKPMAQWIRPRSSLTSLRTALEDSDSSKCKTGKKVLRRSRNLIPRTSAAAA